MTWVGWLGIGIAVAVAAFDWFLVMGANPRKWKGGDIEDIDSEYRKERR